MRKNKERQEHGQFRDRKNAKLANLIRDTRNYRGVVWLFSQICAAYTTSYEQLKRNVRQPGVALDRAGYRINPAGKVRGRGKSSASKDP
jgi:hypothetical protein